MPRNEKERVLYIFMQCLLMTWILGILSGMLNAGEISMRPVLAATKQEPIVFCFAFAIAMLGIQKLSVKAAFRVVSRSDSENAKILACTLFMVLFMSPLVLLFRVTLNNGISANLPWLWFTSWLRGFTMAFFLNLLVAGPIGRAVLRMTRK